MTSCTTILHWDMGHRVYGHEGKCAHLHGHRYSAHITCKGAQDDLGRVIDFGWVKEAVGAWVDNNWDHRTMLYREDPLAGYGEIEYAVSVPMNPTAENIAIMLLDKARELLDEYGIKVTKVTVWETPNCYATAK